MILLETNCSRKDKEYLSRLSDEFGVECSWEAVVNEYAIETLVHQHGMSLKEIYDSLSRLKDMGTAMRGAIYAARAHKAGSAPVQGTVMFDGVDGRVLKVLNSMSVRDDHGNLSGSYERVLGVMLGIREFPESSDLLFGSIPLEVKYAERSVFEVSVPDGGVMIAFYNQHIKAVSSTVKYAVFGHPGQLQHYFTNDESLKRRGKFKMNRLNGVLIRK